VKHVSRRAFGAGAIGIAAIGVLNACTNSSEAPASSGTAGTSGSASVVPSPSSKTTPKAAPAVITINPADGTAGVNPVIPITVISVGGAINAVSLVSSDGAAVPGTLSADSATWTAGETLGYSHTYTLTATATNADGVPATTIANFTTLTPSNQTMPYLNTRSGGALTDGATYGVGMVIRVRFDENIGDKAAAEKALVVTTTPAVDGAWSWIDARNALWRPQNYYPAGTKVSVNANVFGVQVGDGLFGQSDVGLSFTIGSKHVSIADDNTHQVSVYFDDVLQRTMPTSMGQGGYVAGDKGQQISLYTPSGIYTVLGQANPVLMDSSTFGLPVDSPKGYKEYIAWATQISTDGIYLHELETTVWAQGNTDTSHGCLNLNHDNASWFYANAVVGDVVQIQNTGGAPLAQWQNGDWSVAWTDWLANSALPH
jgi:lipoprotein-anchoring transpeptidase ErfK/SrfK